MNTQDLILNTYRNTYAGPEKLYKILQNKGVTNIGRTKIKRILNGEDSYTLRKELRKSFKRAQVVVSGTDDERDMDLADVSNITSENDDIKFLLIAIDIFSKYLWVQPLKNKTAKDV